MTYSGKSAAKSTSTFGKCESNKKESPTEFEVGKMKDKAYKKWLTTFTKKQ